MVCSTTSARGVLCLLAAWAVRLEVDHQALVAIASSTESVRLAEQPPASWQSLGGGEKGRQAAHQGGWATSGYLNSAWRSVGWLMSARMNSIQQSRPELQYLRRPGSYMGGYMGAALAVPMLPVL